MATYPPSTPNLFALAFPATKKDFRSSRVALRRVETSPILFKLIILLIFGEFYVFANLKNIFNNLKKNLRGLCVKFQQEIIIKS